jgi:fatty acid desaturase
MQAQESDRPSPGRLFSHPQDLHCAIYHLIVVAAYAAAFWLWLHPEVSGVDGFWARAAFATGAAPLLGWISGIDVGVNFHNHTHRRIFRSAFLNRWFARQWTITGGWPAAYWHHLHVTVHHTYLLGERDWTVPRRDHHGRFESSLSYQLKHWPWRTARHFYLDIRDGRFDRRRAGKELLWFAALWSIPFWIDPVMALCLWVLPHCSANIITLGRGMYVQHAGCEAFPTNPTAPHSNDFTLRFFNLTMFNIGYHTEHHDYPGVHWSDLPQCHAQVTQRRSDAERNKDDQARTA